MTDSEKMWYFAFGSNMNPKVLTDRRNVHPTQSKPCYVPKWYLNFDVPAIPYIEPSFASIGQTPLDPLQPEVNGVVHEITQEEYEQIRRTERGGGHQGIGYASVAITVHTYDGEKLKAYTLVETPTRRLHGIFYPSKRYMKLLEDGAMQFELRPFYQDWLKTLPRYEHQNTIRHFVGKVLYLTLVVSFFVPLALPFIIRYLMAVKYSPRWTYLLSNFVIRILGHVYHFVFLPIFGPGAGENCLPDK